MTDLQSLDTSIFSVEVVNEACEVHRELLTAAVGRYYGDSRIVPLCEYTFGGGILARNYRLARDASSGEVDLTSTNATQYFGSVQSCIDFARSATY